MRRRARESQKAGLSENKDSQEKQAELALDFRCGEPSWEGAGLMHKEDLWFASRCGWGCLEGEKQMSPGPAASFRSQLPIQIGGPS